MNVRTIHPSTYPLTGRDYALALCLLSLLSEENSLLSRKLPMQKETISIKPQQCSVYVEKIYSI